MPRVTGRPRKGGTRRDAAVPLWVESYVRDWIDAQEGSRADVVSALVDDRIAAEKGAGEE